MISLKSRLDLVATVALLALLPFLFTNDYWFDVAIRMGLAAIAAIGLNILMGFAGQLSIAHAALIAFSAYSTGILTASFHLPPVVSIPVSILATAAICYLIGHPLLKLHGFALAIGTLGLGIITQIVLVNEVGWTGGPDGMVVPPLTVGPFMFVSEWHWYALVAVFLVAAIMASKALHDSPGGRALRALNSSEIAAQVCGVDTRAMKIRAFALAGVFAGLSGSLTAHYSGFITPDISAFMNSVVFATMVVLGGRGSTYGAVIGALLLTLLPQLLGGAGDLERIAFGLILTLTMLFMPKGIVPTLAARFGRPRS